MSGIPLDRWLQIMQEMSTIQAGIRDGSTLMFLDGTSSSITAMAGATTLIYMSTVPATGLIRVLAPARCPILIHIPTRITTHMMMGR